MKIIVLRDSGSNVSMRVSRRRLLGFALITSVISLGLGLFLQTTFSDTESVDTEMVAHWRAKLNQQRDEVVAIERRTQAQSEAVGRQLAQMQARLLRMEALGTHMTGDLQSEEFDFTQAPAQGGPVEGAQSTLAWHELSTEIERLSGQLKRRETELSILDSVLASEHRHAGAQVQGRPVNWGWLSSPYGNRVDPITGKTAWHSGVDFAGKDGSDVIAVASGVVTFAGERSGYGKIVEVSHANGLVTRYAHHKALRVETGQVVKKGELLGIMGSSGRSTGPHVHFEVLKNGRHVDPVGYVTGS